MKSTGTISITRGCFKTTWSERSFFRQPSRTGRAFFHPWTVRIAFPRRCEGALGPVYYRPMRAAGEETEIKLAIASGAGGGGGRRGRLAPPAGGGGGEGNGNQAGHRFGGGGAAPSAATRLPRRPAAPL